MRALPYRPISCIQSTRVRGLALVMGLLATAACESSIAPVVRTLVVAHRGFAAEYPENTLVALLAAEAAGADMVEVDVHRSRDGVAMVIHDPTLERTTNGTGLVSDRTAAELGGLDAGGWYDPAFAGEPVPTLEAVLRHLAGGGVRVLIEVKADAQGQPYPGFEAEVVRVLRETRTLSKVAIDSYYPEILTRFAALVPELPLAYDPSAAEYAEAEGGPAELLPLAALRRRANILSLDQEYVDAEMVAAALRRGVPLWAWGVRHDARLEQLARWGVEAVLTPDPAWARAVIDRSALP
jgi:glycerophosphoryl diester phosphodiesterase